MKYLDRLLYILVFFVFVVSLFGVSLSVVQARDAQAGAETTVFLTARVQNRWLHEGNLHCESATLETGGQTYEGEIRAGHWRGNGSDESCFIAFNNLPTSLDLKSAKVMVSHVTLVGGESAESIPADRLQVQEKDYVDEQAALDKHVVLDDMILASGQSGGQNGGKTPTTVSLTARVVNKWWVGGTLHCESATLETLGQTYNGAITLANAQTLSGDDACFIVFNNVLLPIGATPGRVTVRYYPLLGDELIEQVTSDRKQTQSNDYLLKKAGANDQVKLDDMILRDNNKTPAIEIDPNDTIVPDLPDPSEIIPGL